MNPRISREELIFRLRGLADALEDPKIAASAVISLVATIPGGVASLSFLGDESAVSEIFVVMGGVQYNLLSFADEVAATATPEERK